MCLSESRKSESFALAKEQKVLEKLVDILTEENQITLAEGVGLKERIKKYGGTLRCGR
jgi:hypothetical protein